MNNTTALFKLQHPEDLISRLFILEYIRELGEEKIKEKNISEERYNKRKEILEKYDINKDKTS